MSIVRWCVVDDSCPYSNAFWDGSQAVFGEGWGAADDVVAHELTHGYVEKTAALFSLNQSGALNESFGDTIGEIVDHRNAASTESDADWVLGEDLPGVGIARSMKDPTLSGQPDRMTSPKYVTSDMTFGIDGIHENGGISNKTAYLISQGGDFNSRTLTGIDAGDASLSKTALLYLEVIPKLTSGAQYADLGRALRSTCAELAAAGTAGFTDADCESVGIADEATELSSRPTDPRASHREAPYSCTVGHRRVDVWRDDDGASVFGFTRGALWHRTPEGNTPRVSSSLARVGRNRPFSVTGKVVRRGTAAAVRMMPVVLQRRAVDQSSWRTVAYGRTGPGGTRTWSVAQSGPMVYRVLARGVSTTFGSTSTGQVVRIR